MKKIRKGPCILRLLFLYHREMRSTFRDIKTLRIGEADRNEVMMGESIGEQ